MVQHPKCTMEMDSISIVFEITHMLRWIAITSLSLALFGCGQDKSIKKGVNDGLKIQETTIGTKGVPLPEAAKAKNTDKSGFGGKSDAGKSGK